MDQGVEALGYLGALELRLVFGPKHMGKHDKEKTHHLKRKSILKKMLKHLRDPK